MLAAGRGRMPAFRLTREADEDVVRLYVDGAGQFGFEQAERYYADLWRTFAFLAEYPFAARERTEFKPPVRIHPFRSHMIVYRAGNGPVQVLRVRHARENWEADPTG